MKPPSKKIILTLIACIIVVGGIYYVWHKTGAPNAPANPQTAANIQVLQAITQKNSTVDSDGDGLNDWEETLWGTDPHNPDTDGDGTPDGEEVKEGRNPLKANTAGQGQPPNDVNASTTVSSALSQASSTEGLTSTDLFARAFFTNYMRLKSEGVVMSSSSEQEIIDETLNDGDYNISQPTVYTSSDINNSGADDSASIRAYGNKLGEIEVNDSPQEKHDNEIEVFMKALNDQNEDDLKGEDIIIDGYQKILNDYLAMQVPSSALLDQLDLVNSVSAVLLDIQAMRNSFEDPITAYARLNQYQTDAANLKQAIANLGTYFQSNGITFEQSEYGYVFLHGI